MPRSGDPLEDFHRHEMRKEEWLNRLPKCKRCGHPIQQEWAVCIDGVWYCDDCIEFYRKEICSE